MRRRVRTVSALVAALALATSFAVSIGPALCPSFTEMAAVRGAGATGPEAHLACALAHGRDAEDERSPECPLGPAMFGCFAPVVLPAHPATALVTAPDGVVVSLFVHAEPTSAPGATLFHPPRA